MPETELSVNVEPRYGFYPWWPEDGNDWIHPDDVEVARQMIPSQRVFRREGEARPFVLLFYGDVKLRVLRTLWREVDSEGFELGDMVEVLSRMRHNEPHTGTIREMLWDDRTRRLRYQLLVNGQPMAKFYTSEDLRHVEPTTEKLGG